MQASVPESSCKTLSGYNVKSFIMMTLSFGSLVTASGRLRRDRATTEVMDGLFRHWRRVSEPMKPVAPLSITFMARLRSVSNGNNSQAIRATPLRQFGRRDDGLDERRSRECSYEPPTICQYSRSTTPSVFQNSLLRQSGMFAAEC